MPLTENEQKILDAIPAGGDTVSVIARGAGLTRQATTRLLGLLEKKGRVERTPNPWGPETPAWWAKLPAAPAEDFTPPELVKDAIYDRGRVEDRIWILLTGKQNEYGCAEVWLHSGEHQPRKTWVPLHLIGLFPWYTLRLRGEVTTWSDQFSCPVHGSCTAEMVSTAKTCTLCGEMLIRHG